jgi:hypothetical protein
LRSALLHCKSLLRKQKRQQLPSNVLLFQQAASQPAKHPLGCRVLLPHCAIQGQLCLFPGGGFWCLVWHRPLAALLIQGSALWSLVCCVGLGTLG